MFTCTGYAAGSADAKLAPFTFERRDTVAAQHDINANLGLLKRDCTPVQVGGIAETQEMPDFCGKHGITADIEMIPIDQIETAYSRILKSDVKDRFVIDMASLPKAA